ncbi:MAG: hypothetical protein AAB388_03480 [Patescibacteria group bacterium]
MSQKAPTRIRTFAQDLEAERIKTGQPEKEAVKTATSVPQKPIIKETVASPAVPKKHAPPPPQKSPVPKKPAEPLTIKEDPIVVDGDVEHVPKHIPAFHELQKSAKKHADEAESLATVPVKKSGGGGTVITDTKKAHTPMLPAIGASLRSWLKALKKQLAGKKKRVYTVPETERRKGVIQKATSKTAAIFTADNETLKEQIRRRQLGPTSEETRDAVEVSWSPNTETGFSLLEERKEALPDEPPAVDVGPTQTGSVQIEYKKFSESVSSNEFLPPYDVEDTRWEDAAKRFANEEQTGNNDRTPIAEPTVVSRTPAVESVAIATKDTDETGIPEIPRAHVPWWSLEHIYRISTNAITLGLFFTAVVLVIGLYGATYIMDFIAPTENATLDADITADITPILAETDVSYIRVPAFTFNNIVLAIARSKPKVNFHASEYAIASQKGNAFSTEQLLAVLDFQTKRSFTDSVAAVRIVYSNQSEPVLLLSVTNLVEVKGDLFDWERTMYTDVGPLIEAPPVKGKTSDFADQSVNGVDTRVLLIEGKPLLVYGFVRENVVAFAPSPEAFAEFIEAK